MRFFAIAGLVFAWGLLPAASHAIEGVEPYSSRPSVLTVEPQAHTGLGNDWEKLKRGHIEAVAQLLELYPDREIYFLARDSELLYDLAKYVTQNEPAVHARIHLLNVSRANMRDPHVKDYLAQEGISEAALKAGKKVLFVDTGFSGTIPRVIGEQFAPELKQQLQTHLMSSSNSAHPSSRVFLAAMNPAVNLSGPASMHGTVVSYEHLPRYTDRSDHFEKINNRWEPVSKVDRATDGSVSKEKAIAYQQDLIAFVNSSSQKTLLQKRRAQWRELMNTPKSKQLDRLKDLLQTSRGRDPFPEAMVRDWMDITLTNRNELHSAISYEQLGIAPQVAPVGLSNKNSLITQHPEWAPILENPEAGIQSLIKKGEWGTLGSITDVLQDQEFFRILAKKLGSEPPTPGHRHFIQMLIEKGDTPTLTLLANHTFSQPQTKELKDLIALLIEKGPQSVHQNLAISTFTQPHTSEMKDLISKLVESNDQDTLRKLASYTFSTPEAIHMKALIARTIELADQKTLQALASQTFSRPHTESMKDLLARLIERSEPEVLNSLVQSAFFHPQSADYNDLFEKILERGGPSTYLSASYNFEHPHSVAWTNSLNKMIEQGEIPVLNSLAQNAFSRPHAVVWKEQLARLIKRGDTSTLRLLAISVFSLPHSAGWKDLLSQTIEKAIESADHQTLFLIAGCVFSRPHSAEMKDLLARVIENADQRTLNEISSLIPRSPWWDRKDYEIFKKALTLSDPRERKRILQGSPSGCLETVLKEIL